MKIGINLYSLRNLLKTEEDFKNTLLKLKKEGCDYVQFSGSPLSLETASRISKEVKMPIVLTHSPCSRIVCDLDNLMKDHKKCKCKNIGLSMMPNVGVYSDDKTLKCAVRVFNERAKTMQENGFKFFYHNHFHEFIKLKDGTIIFDYLIKNAPYFNFTLDTYWLQYGGVSIIDTIHKLKGRIECVHLKDYMISKDDLMPHFAPLGDGTLNFKEIVKEARKSGTKYFLIEQDNAADLPDGLAQVIKSIKYAKKYL